MADGLALLVAPRQVIERVRELLRLTPSILRWEGIAICLGLVVVFGAQALPYQPLWTVAGVVMMVKGLFFLLGPDLWRRGLVDWCLRREEIDYRLVGICLCALAVLLLHALGWLGGDHATW
ncbi:MAG: hypothetical protein ACREI3_12930 [Nitrospirales bacterium]